MADVSSSIRERRALDVALGWMLDDPIILLEGPRSVGKSTLLRQIADVRGGRVLDLDDPAERDAVAADPSLYIDRDEFVCVDEYQNAPIVLDAIKSALNKRTEPGRFMLAGSARHDALPAAAQALTGRLTRLPIYPLSQGELDETNETFLSEALTDANAVIRGSRSQTTRQQYIDRVTRGGFPLAIRASSAAARGRWMDSYVELTLERDVTELSRIRQGHLLQSLLERVAGQTAQVLNIEKAARDVGLDKATTDSYVTLLEKVFLLYRLPAWGKTLTARSGSSPKVHVVDSGIAARLLRLTPAKLATLDPTAQTEFGHLLETFVVNELRKQASWADGVSAVGHWRTHDGLEVDLVIETEDGRVIGFEVKSGSRIPGEDLRPLTKLRDAVGRNFAGGFALYLGEREYTYDDRIHVLPVDRLWT